jgi:MoaA/NifB/PqqE/SkfB family radical SAM enzyme
MEKILRSVYQDKFEPHQRLIFSFAKDEYDELDQPVGNLMKNLQQTLNKVDISNWFVVIVTEDANCNTREFKEAMSTLSTDKNPITVHVIGEDKDKKLVKRNKNYQYASVDPINVNLDDLTESHQYLLRDSKTFCMLPWIHLHAYPNGDAWPCCQADMSAGSLGSTKQDTLETIWNNQRMRTLRQNMLEDVHDNLCNRCYEQEASGMFSGRRSANKHHGHNIELVDKTLQDGTVADFELSYWDIRFSNLCNLSCRSCGHIFSSSWYKDQIALAGPQYAKEHSALNYAGRYETDIWEQLLEHIDYVEQIYFAGGEPLMMEEHYLILEELERRGKFDVRLIYNTNFTHVKLKDRLVFDYWKKFDSVAVGASLDAMGPRAEYIRKGTHWQTVEHNRKQMLEICPRVDFYISPTMSIMNALHLPDFHRDWVEKGLIKPQDLNVNILQDPPFYRVDIAPAQYKQRIQDKIEKHLEWLTPLDKLNRAAAGFKDTLTFMYKKDNTDLLSRFWERTESLDIIRNENIFDAIPEMEEMHAYSS